MDPENKVGNHNSEPASQSLLNREGCDTDDVAGSPSISGPVAVPSCPGLTSDNTDQLQNQIHEEPVTSSDNNDIHDYQSKDSDEGVQSEALNFEDELVSMINFCYELQEQMNRPIEDGITNACLLRNSQDPTILARIVPQQEDITACSRGNDNSSCSILNRDLVANSVDGTDNSLVALEQRVTEACALVERVLREREEREQFGREIERKEQMIREERERERREREEREIEEAERWPQHQEAITAHSQWLCEHYQHRCRVRFPCCADFYPCHRCHNNSIVCDNKDVKAHHATHFLCSRCCSEQEVDGNGMKCHRCGRNMSAYVCFNCGHFSPTDEDTYQCEKCGICRIQTEKACEDQCCFCLEDAFSGRQCLPCSHTVHRECLLAMIQDSIMTCPICRYPLYNPSGW